MSRKASFVMMSIGCLVFIGIGLFLIMLWTVPAFRPFGMDGIWIQSKYMTYIGDEFDHIFRQRNMVIESRSAEIIIRVRKIGFEDEARVQVFENANGISFNSISRTHVDFLESLDENGVPYSRIIVREPRGAISRTARVYINLVREEGVIQNPYNFTLETGRSPVTFNFV